MQPHSGTTLLPPDPIITAHIAHQYYLTHRGIKQPHSKLMGRSRLNKKNLMEEALGRTDSIHAVSDVDIKTPVCYGELWRCDF